MENRNDRPVCHRAEDLVTYLYGEATPDEARDFAHHMQQCDACRAEFSLFNHVHESIIVWRNEALGPVAIAQPEVYRQPAAPVLAPAVAHERKLSARAALREFFSVSPLWLRGATALAGLLLCALIVFAVSRTWRQPTVVANNGNPTNSSREEFERAVQKEVEVRLAELARTRNNDERAPAAPVKEVRPNAPVVTNRSRRKNPARLTRQESEQLAADLGLIPGREEDLPFVLPDEPNQ